MLAYLIALLTRFAPKDEKGQDAAEYALLIALIALVIIIAVGALGTRINDIFNAIVAALPVP